MKMNPGVKIISEWIEKRLAEMIDVNLVVKLTKGESYPFIDIDKVEKQNKFVSKGLSRFS